MTEKQGGKYRKLTQRTFAQEIGLDTAASDCKRLCSGHSKLEVFASWESYPVRSRRFDRKSAISLTIRKAPPGKAENFTL